MNAPADLDLTLDAFLGGAVRLRQPAHGYRAGHDAVLLAAALDAQPGERLLEAGCGAGTVLACAAHRLPGALFEGIERDAAMAQLAVDNIMLNGLGGRVGVRVGSVAERPADLENAFDQAFANPPYFEPGAVRAPAASRTGAYLADVSLRDWIVFLLHAVRHGGRVTMIHRAAALADILSLLSTRAGEIEILPIHSAQNAPAKRVLVRARKGLRPGALTLYRGLMLTGADGAPSEAAAEALAGGRLDWR